MELNHLRRLQLHGTTKPWIFFQLKKLFHLLESVGSARIEGNRTTISEYIEQKLEDAERSSERFSEIANVEEAMEHIENSVDAESEISHTLIRELHQLTVRSLDEEGDKTPGAYRTWKVRIAKSKHVPPEHLKVQEYMNGLIEFINANHDSKYDLIKIAIAHHRFAWIHPFGNGNGRVVRLLTYALLIKYGFKVKDGQLLNPTAVFCNDREKYYEELATADEGSEQAIMQWTEYVLSGICSEISKVNKLLDHNYLAKHLLKPAIVTSRERGLINKEEEAILKMGVEEQSFKAANIKKILPRLTARQRTYLIAKLKDNKMIQPFSNSSREYFVNFTNSYLIRALIQKLESEKFVPSIN